VSALAGKALVRLVLKDDKVIAEERLLTELGARIRGVNQGPDGALYVLTDGNAGKIIKLVPSERKIGLSIRAMKSDEFKTDWEDYSSKAGSSETTLGDHFKAQN